MPGTGAVGIEALSRGAAHVTFVERDPRAVALIEANLRRCGVTDRYAIIRAGFAGRVRPRSSASFDVIFLDPPYGAAELAAALAAAEPLVGDGDAARRRAREARRGARAGGHASAAP